jgi:hypothetical protein
MMQSRTASVDSKSSISSGRSFYMDRTDLWITSVWSVGWEATASQPAHQYSFVGSGSTGAPALIDSGTSFLVVSPEIFNFLFGDLATGGAGAGGSESSHKGGASAHKSEESNASSHKAKNGSSDDDDSSSSDSSASHKIPTVSKDKSLLRRLSSAVSAGLELVGLSEEKSSGSDEHQAGKEEKADGNAKEHTSSHEKSDGNSSSHEEHSVSDTSSHEKQASHSMFGGSSSIFGSIFGSLNPGKSTSNKSDGSVFGSGGIFGSGIFGSLGGFLSGGKHHGDGNGSDDGSGSGSGSDGSGSSSGNQKASGSENEKNVNRIQRKKNYFGLDGCEPYPGKDTILICKCPKSTSGLPPLSMTMIDGEDYPH